MSLRRKFVHFRAEISPGEAPEASLRRVLARSPQPFPPLCGSRVARRSSPLDRCRERPLLSLFWALNVRVFVRKDLPLA